MAKSVVRTGGDLVEIERFFFLLRSRLVALGGARLRVLVERRRAGGGDARLAGLHEDAHLLIALLLRGPEFGGHIQDLLPVQAVLYAQCVSEVVIVKVVEERAVDRRVHEGFSVLS